MDGVLVWNLILVTTLVVGAVLAVALAVWAVRRAKARPAQPEAGPLDPLEKVLVSIIGSGALLAVPFSVLGLITSGINLATAPSVRVDGIALGNSNYPPFLVASDAPVDAGYESAWVDVANLPVGVRWLLWTEQALPIVLALVIAVAVGWLALSLLRGTPFTRAFPAVLGVVAIAVIGTGLGTQLFGGIARAETVAFLGPARDITAGDDGSGPREGFVAFSVALDLGPIGWGFGIILVAAAFAIGTRLQRETRGLV
jgi:hypothetical protein